MNVVNTYNTQCVRWWRWCGKPEQEGFELVNRMAKEGLTEHRRAGGRGLGRVDVKGWLIPRGETARAKALRREWA